MKHVVIIGGGFSGAVTAVNLAQPTDTPLLVESPHPTIAHDKAVAAIATKRYIETSETVA